MPSHPSTAIEQTVEFTVPYLVPPSGNHYKEPCRYMGKGGYLRLGYRITAEAKAYYDAVAIFAQGRTVSPEDNKERKRVRYGVQMNVYLGPNMHGDFDNFWKCGLDALVRSGVIHSDARVSGKHSNSIVHKDQRDNPRTHYTVTRLED
jgi:hypothetical protein